MFQFFEVSEQEKEDLLGKMAAKGVDKKKGFINLLFKR